jgi:hypothetical protein
VSDVGNELSLGTPAKFDKSINSKFNESTQSLLKMEKLSISQEITTSTEKRKTEMTIR